MATTISTTKPRRRERRPSYSFNIATRPYQLCPFLLAPVLPGETMKNFMMQSRVVTDPIKSRLMGWHKEYYFFYVRLRDLAGAADFEEMMLNPEKDMSAYYSAASIPYMHRGGINWRKLALDKVVEHYFRVPDDPDLAAAIDGLPAVSVDQDTVLDSMITASKYAGPADVDVDENNDDTITTGEIDKAMRMWEVLRANNFTAMDFDDYLRTFGISVPKAQSDKPELIRFLRDWQYPTNTVNPENGTPTTAVSWAIRDRADKDRLFREPGFIIGVTVARPKVYLSGLIGSFTSTMSDALSWLPAIMRDDPWTSVRLYDNLVNSPLVGQAEDYYLDIKDLFLYGENFWNHAGADLQTVALPSADGKKRYPTWTMLQGLFVGADDTKRFIKEDGRIDLTISGALKDTTPNAMRM